jgi:hypothetical protein
MASLAAKLLCVGVCCAVRWLVCAAAMQALWLHSDGMMCSTVLFHAVLLGFLLLLSNNLTSHDVVLV